MERVENNFPIRKQKSSRQRGFETNKFKINNVSQESKSDGRVGRLQEPH
jgi:hypothetical protein